MEISTRSVFTGDSIVVAPNQTLPDVQYQQLRSATPSRSRLKIEGLQRSTGPSPISDYYVIEVNRGLAVRRPRLQSDWLHPIAKIAAKIAVGLNLSEITNPVTQTTIAAFEPASTTVVKLPRFPFDKFGEPIAT